MVTISGGFRTNFREEITKFCQENDLEITYRSCLGNYELYNISGETFIIDQLMEYNKHLENQRNNKSLWWKIWN